MTSTSPESGHVPAPEDITFRGELSSNGYEGVSFGFDVIHDGLHFAGFVKEGWNGIRSTYGVSIQRAYEYAALEPSTLISGLDSIMPHYAPAIRFHQVAVQSIITMCKTRHMLYRPDPHQLELDLGLDTK